MDDKKILEFLNKIYKILNPNKEIYTIKFYDYYIIYHVIGHEMIAGSFEPIISRLAYIDDKQKIINIYNLITEIESLNINDSIKIGIIEKILNICLNN